jgi:[acyl-carrier-protein] S-malonyltransferase
VAAGTLTFADAVRLVRNRGRYMQEAVPVGAGAMAAILGLDAAGVEKACAEAAEGDVISAANLNAPGQIAIAGSSEAVKRAIDRAKALGARRAIPLQVSAPFHCALMKPAEERLAPELRAVDAHAPRVPVVANVDAEPKTDAPSAIDALIRQIASPVRWEDVVRRMVADGVTAFVEVGPGSVLSGLGRKIARDVTFVNIDAPEHLPDVEALFAAQAQTA